MVHDERLKAILNTKDHKEARAAAKRYGNSSECWHIIDGCLVIYDEADPPAWLATALAAADEDGKTPEFYLRQPV